MRLKGSQLLGQGQQCFARSAWLSIVCGYQKKKKKAFEMHKETFTTGNWETSISVIRESSVIK